MEHETFDEESAYPTEVKLYSLSETLYGKRPELSHLEREEMDVEGINYVVDTYAWVEYLRGTKGQTDDLKSHYVVTRSNELIEISKTTKENLIEHIKQNIATQEKLRLQMFDINNRHLKNWVEVLWKKK